MGQHLTAFWFRQSELSNAPANVRRVVEISCDCPRNHVEYKFPQKVKTKCEACGSAREKEIYFDFSTDTYETRCLECGDYRKGI